MVAVVTKYTVVSAKLSEDLYQELALRIPEGERSNFIREAIFEKLEKTPRPNKLLDLEDQLNQLTKTVNTIKNSLAQLELIAHESGKTNPYIFCVDTIDNKLITYLIDHRGATTPELAKHLEINRWLVLNRLRKIEKASKKQLGTPIIEYYAGQRNEKRKAWWINESLIET
jgi:hypothetical protein